MNSHIIVYTFHTACFLSYVLYTATATRQIPLKSLCAELTIYCTVQTGKNPFDNQPGPGGVASSLRETRKREIM